MASQVERRLVGVFQTSLKLSASAASPSFREQRRRVNNYESGGMRYLDMGGPNHKRDPNDPRRAKLPDGPALGVDSTERVPYTYGGKIKPHYHVFRQLWPEPTLLKRKFGPKADPAKTSKPVDHVQVPMRKVRSSTAVLEALASTVQIESNSVPHDLMDDPYLLPLSQFQMMDYRGAKASGRRVAQRIAEDHPYFFDLKFFRPDPVIQSLESGAPDWKHVISEDGGVLYDDVIRERLEAGRHDLAFSAYEACHEQKSQLSPDVMTSLFEIAAFHNLATDADFDMLRPSYDEETEEQNIDGIREKESISAILACRDITRDDEWDPAGIAEDLWRRLPKTDALHCAMIQALVRHGATQRAYDHFTTMIEEGKVVDVPTFNALLKWHNEIDTNVQCGLSKEDLDEMVFKKILRIMAERGVRPTVGTFNAVLHGLQDQRLPNYRGSHADEVLVEMIDLQLRPTLGTLALVIKSWRMPSRLEFAPAMLDWILKIIEAGNFDAGVEDDYDQNFFLIAIKLLSLREVQLSPEIPELARRMDNLVSANPLCRAAATRKSFIFHGFIKELLFVLASNGHLDDAMRVFSNYIPNYLQPTRNDWFLIMKAIAQSGRISVRHVVTLGNEYCSPMAYGSGDTADIFTSMLDPGIARDEDELEALIAVAANYFRGYERVQDIQNKKEKRLEYGVHGPEMPAKEKIRLSGYAYGSLLFTLSHGERLGDAIDLFNHYMKEADKIYGTPPVDGVALLMRRVAKSPKISNSKKGGIMVKALKFLDEVGAKRHLAEGLELMVEEVALDATSALIVTELKKQVKAKSESPERAEY